jgi:predicted GIY-YIG superfamily endonuclease
MSIEPTIQGRKRKRELPQSPTIPEVTIPLAESKDVGSGDNPKYFAVDLCIPSDTDTKTVLTSLTDSFVSSSSSPSRTAKPKDLHLSSRFLTQSKLSSLDISPEGVDERIKKLRADSLRDPGLASGKGKDAPVALYLLEAQKARDGTYTGISNNIRRRLGSHNYQDMNSHSYTAQKGRPWSLVATVKGFRNRETAKQFEKLVKTYPCDSIPYASITDNRLYRILQVSHALIWEPLLIEVDSNLNLTCLSTFPPPAYCVVDRTTWFTEFNRENHTLGKTGWFALCEREGWADDGSFL